MGGDDLPEEVQSAAPEENGGAVGRKQKRKAMKKRKRKEKRKDAAIKEKEEEEALANDPEEQKKLTIREQEEAAASERERREFEERERAWLEAADARRRKAMEEEAVHEAEKKKLLEDESRLHQDEVDDEWEYVEEGPAEIIWKDNEIIVKKKKVKVPKRSADQLLNKKEDDRPTSNPLPPQSAAFAAFNCEPPLSAQELLESVAQQTPNFGTEQDKAHCPFHLKTGVCRFGSRCNRTHFYPDKSCTLLIKSMYSGPGLAWEQDEGLESLMHTDEEIERSYEEFYEDVHTEFLKFGEIVNFKVCRNGSFHLRGNVYVHYRNLESAVLAHNSLNGRYFAGKQIACEFIGVTRWKIAICGEYMKSRLKTCSRGTACNFIHCFRNPGGDYEWADWDNLPPKYWVKKMTVLFGSPGEDRELPENYRSPRKRSRSYSGIRNGERDFHEVISEKEASDYHRGHHTSGREHSGRRTGSMSFKRWQNSHEKDNSDSGHHLDVRHSFHLSPRENEHGEVGTNVFRNGEKSNNEKHHKNENHRKRESCSPSITREKCSSEESKKGENSKLRSHGSSTDTSIGCVNVEHKTGESVSRYHTHYDGQYDLSNCGSKTEYDDGHDRYVDQLGKGGENRCSSQYHSRDVSKERRSESNFRRYEDRHPSVSSDESFGDMKNGNDRSKFGFRDRFSVSRSLKNTEESEELDHYAENEKNHSAYKVKHHQKNRVHEDCEQTNGFSDSADPHSKKESKRSSKRGTSISSKRKGRH